MGSRRPSPPNITFPPRGGTRPQPPRPQPPRPQPPRPEPPRPQPPRPEIVDYFPQPPSGNRPQPPRPTPPRPQPPRPQPPRPTPRPPTTPSGPVTPPTGITSPPEIGRRFPDGRPPRPTGFFGPQKDYRKGPMGPDGQRPRRRMAGERPMVVERVTTEAPRRSRFRDDDTMSRDFEGFRQRRPKRDVNIAQQDI